MIEKALNQKEDELLLDTDKSLIVLQCNLDYPDLVYPEPRLSGLVGDKKIHYHACTEGLANDLLWVWSQLER